jgi:hypothetical protein
MISWLAELEKLMVYISTPILYEYIAVQFAISFTELLQFEH